MYMHVALLFFMNVKNHAEANPLTHLYAGCKWIVRNWGKTFLKR